MRSIILLPCLLAIAACSDREPPTEAEREAPPVSIGTPIPGPVWDLAADAEDVRLVFAEGERPPLVRALCTAGAKRLLVNVPTFDPIASEERMSIGADAIVTALVADPDGDADRGGVTGEGPTPDELGDILASPAGLRVNYGAQHAGPFPPIPAAMARDFLAACGG